MTLILIADDDQNLRYSFQRMLEGRGYTFAEAVDGRDAVDKVRENRPDLVVMDVRMPGMDGLTAFDQIKRLSPDLPVIIMTAYGTTATAIEAMKKGAFDYTLKPFTVDEMSAMVSRAVEQTHSPSKVLRVEPPQEDPPTRGKPLIGSSRAMQKVYKAIGQIAESDVHVLILGESGTGKELVARAIHEHSKRAGGPFLPINCAAVPEHLIESELFGHEKGAFTGAGEAKAGLLQASDSGTVLLDEIGEVPVGAQAKLLRLLQEGEVIRLGSDAPTRLNVRIIAASNRDLQEAVGRDRFRADLFYRLNGVSVELPPLKDKLEDLDELVPFFVHRFNREYGKAFSQIAGGTMQLLRERSWPGNVRELENVIRKAVLIGHGEVLLPSHLVSSAGENGAPATRSVEEELGESIDEVADRLIEAFSKEDDLPLIPTMERLLISRVLKRTGGNQVRAAATLGISRNTLRSRIERYGLGHAR